MSMIPTADNRIDFFANGRVRAFMVTKDLGRLYYEGMIYFVNGWDEHTGLPDDCLEIGPIALDSEGCSHIGVRDPDLGKTWLHVCGADGYRLLLDILEWAWKEARARIDGYLTEIGGEL